MYGIYVAFLSLLILATKSWSSLRKDQTHDVCKVEVESGQISFSYKIYRRRNDTNICIQYIVSTEGVVVFRFFPPVCKCRLRKRNTGGDICHLAAYSIELTFWNLTLWPPLWIGIKQVYRKGSILLWTSKSIQLLYEIIIWAWKHFQFPNE